MKRLFDVVMSLLGLALASPIMLVAAAVVKFSSPGPIFYRSLRVGRDGRRFHMLKFRTMVVNADLMSHVVTTPDDDPRTFPHGRALRRSHIDELPQLVNVLLGDMSLVGPRPEVPQYAELFRGPELEILSVRPGITDLASLWIGDKGKLVQGVEDPEQVYLTRIRPKKIELQLEYLRRRSFWLDVQILVRTVLSLVFRVR